MRKKFTWLLSLLVTFGFLGIFSHGYAQEAQETVELYAEQASACYNESNEYVVSISVKDFIQLTKFDLQLNYPAATFNFLGASGVNTALSAMTFQQLVDGELTMQWTGSPVTIGDNLKTEILKLHFSLDNYPNLTAASFSGNLTWAKKDFWYTIPGPAYDAVNTVVSTNGSLSINQAYQTIQSQIVPESCAGGDAIVEITSPANVSYSFNGLAFQSGTNANKIQATPGSTVTVRVKDANGCISHSHSIEVPETIQGLSFTVSKTDPVCANGNGAIVINATGGTGPYTYYIYQGATPPTVAASTSSSNFIFSRPEGEYWVAVQDANGCATLEGSNWAAWWQEVEIVDDNDPIAFDDPVVTDVNCFGGADGTVSVIVTPTAVYSVSIDGGLTWEVTDETGAYTFEDLEAGTYTVKAKNADDCTGELKNIVVAQPAAPITFAFTIKDTSCGGLNDGEITVTSIAGGVAPYDVSIKEGTSAAIVANDVTLPYTFTGLKPTYYSMTVTDANGCVVNYSNPNGTGNVIAVQSPASINFTVVKVNVPCNGGNGTLTVNATGGSGSYLYALNGVYADPNTNVFTVPAGTYTISVKNAEGDACEVSQTSIVVTQPNLLVATIQDAFAPTCIDGTDGYFNLNIAGGTSPYKYSINNGPLSTASTATNIKVAATVGTHTIKVVDAKGCEATVTGVIEQNKTTITAQPTAVINCNGSRTGTITVNITEWPSGRWPMFMYSTNESDVFTNGTGFWPAGPWQTTFYAGVYYVGVVDQYGCQSNVVKVTITENPPLEIVGVTPTAATCYNTFDGNVSILAKGGNTTSWLQYAIVNNPDVNLIGPDRWVNFATYSSITGISSVSFQANKGTYYVFVRDAGCDVVSYGQPVVVTGYEQLKVNENAITKTNILCHGDSTGVINVPLSAVTGGAQSYMFTLHFWNGAAWEVVEEYDQVETGLFEMLPAGTYRVHVEDTEGCPSYTTANIVLGQPATPVTFTMTKKNISCFGANDGLITVNVSGGTVTSTVGYSFTVNNTGTWFPFGVGVTTKTYVATQPGIYTITVKDANGCIAEGQTVTIWEPAPIAVEFTKTNETCALNDGTLTIEETMGGWLGKSTFEYKINASGTYTSATTFTGLPAGNHTLYVKAVVAADDTLQAHGDCYITQPFTIVPFTPITYTVNITDVHCKGEADGTLTVNVTAGGTPSILNGYQVRLTGNDYDETFWTGPDHSVTFEELAHSHYTVYITDSVGCQLQPTVGDDVAPYITVESFEVNEPETLLTVSAQRVKNVSCFNGTDGSFTITAAGGVAPYKFYTAKSVLPAHVLVPEPTSSQWIAAEGNSYTKTNATAGTWIVWVMDANECIMGGEEYQGVPVNEWRVQILQPAQLTLGGIHATANATCHGDADGQIWINPAAITGGNGAPFKFVVTGSNFAGVAVNKTYEGLATSGGYYKLTGLQASYKDGYSGSVRAVDQYTIQVFDANNCPSTTQTAVIYHPKVLVASVAKAQGAFSCPDAVEGFIETTVTGGTTPYKYRLWKNEEEVPFTGWVNYGAFLVQVGNTFTVEVEDAHGCTSLATITIDPVLPAVITGIKDLTCFGATVPTVRLTATGDPGRTFEVRYQKRVGGNLVGTPSAWIPFESANEHVISTGLTYGDVNDADGHYRFWIRDNAGCVSEYYDATFVPVQHALAMTHTVVEGECTSEVTFSVNGGIAPYEIWIDGVMMEDGIEPNTPVTLTLEASEEAYEVVIRDAHECTVTVAELLIEANPVTDEVTVETYFDEEVHYVNEDYEVDEMLNADDSPYTFEFTTEEGCLRVLTVTVVEVYKEVAISAIQGTGAESPLVGMKRAIRGTVTGVVAGQGYFVQDASEAWSGIWVADATTTVAVGDGVYVEGTVSEVNGVTTLTGTGEKLTAAPVTITAVVLASPELAKDEKYESVLVQVKGVRAAAADGDGKWEVYTTADKRATVNKWLFTYAPVTGNFYDVTGIVDGRAANYYLNPRMTSDIRDITATTDITVIDAVDFKVYPNPFNNELYIDNHNKLTRVSITNIAGQRVLDVQYPERVIRTANLVSGVYVVTLFTEEGIVKSERIVKR